MSHANATLTPAGRLRLAKLVVDRRWSYARAAERFSVSITTARRWADRYRELGNTLLRAIGTGTRVGFGTHDVSLVQQLRADARSAGVADSAFEVQMLYGIQDAGRRQLAAAGLRTRVLISYGRAWYPWFMRRLAEKPSNLMLVSRNLFSRGVAQ